MITLTAFPVFQENQVLAAEHLNNVGSFLRQADLDTRRALIGSGIVYGLDLAQGATGLVVGPGAALTTDGYLALLEPDESAQTFRFARHYRDPASYAPFLGQRFPVLGPPTPFAPAPGVSRATPVAALGPGGIPPHRPIELWEAVRTTASSDEDVHALEGSAGAEFLSNKAVLLYLEVTLARLDRCLSNHCLNQGEEYRYQWRVLIGSRSDLEVMRLRGRRGSLLNPAWDLSPLRPNRHTMAPADVESYDALLRSGSSVIQSLRQRLRPTLEQAVRVFAPALDVDPALRDRALAGLSTGLDAQLADFTALTRLGWQHLYDHLRHLFLAWDEFLEAAFGWRSEPAPTRETFPRHVLLGKVPTAARGRPSALRHGFVPSPALTLGGRDRVLVRQRLLRLLTMAAGFSVPNSLGVRLTPGSDGGQPFDLRAVPFYYGPDEVLPWWSASASEQARERRLPTYHREALVQDDEEVQFPERFHSDRADFYRIEGHQGRSRLAVERALDDLRRQYNLPFDVVTVTFGKEASGDDACLCDLDSLSGAHGAAAEEMRCHLKRLLGFVLGLAQRKDPTRPFLVAAVAANGLPTIGLATNDIRFFTPSVAANATPILNRTLKEPAALAGLAGAESLPTVSAPTLASSGSFSTTTQTTSFVGAFAPIQIDFDVIAPSVIATLNPAILTDSLARELVGRLTEVDGFLSTDLASFSATSFQAAVGGARNTATALKDQLSRLLGGSVTDYKPRGVEQALADELVIFLANCVPTRILKIAALYVEAVSRLKLTPALATFLQRHPGIEHRGGVPKGGTFILVVGPRPRPRVFRPVAAPPGILTASVAGTRFLSTAQDLSGLTASLQPVTPVTPTASRQPTATSLTILDGLVASQQLTVQEQQLVSSVRLNLPTDPVAVPDDALRRVFEELRQRFAPDQVLDEGDIVLADFSLPYLCCSGCGCTTQVIIPPPPLPPISIGLPRSEFCRDESAPTPIAVTPPGGSVTGSGVVVPGTAGGFAFVPANATPPDASGRITLTYAATDGRTAQTVVSLVQPPTAAFTIGGIDPGANGFSVVFRNQTVGDATFDWDFGDNSAHAGDVNPSHFYAGEGAFTVTLTATRGPCLAKATFVLELHQDIPVSITLARTRFCANEEIGTPVNVMPPGGTLEGPGAGLDAAGGFVFIPSLAAAATDASSVILTYTATDGRTATQPLDLTQPPDVQFAIGPVQSSADGFGVTFVNKTPGDAAFIWDFGDATGATTRDTTHFYPAEGNYAVTLTATLGPCTTSQTAPLILRRAKIALPGTIFCAGDANRYSISVSPAGGTVSGPGVSGDAAGGFTFVPADAKIAGAVPLVYAAPDGQQARTTAQLVAPPRVSFAATIATGPDGFTVQFENSSDPDVSCAWDFGDGSQSGEFKTSHFYFKPGTYKVSLVVTRGPCTATQVQQLVLLPQVPVSIGLAQAGFCSDDKTAYPIVVQPPGGAVHGPGVGIDSKGSFTFTPAAASGDLGGVTDTATADLTYQVPDGRSQSTRITLSEPPIPAFQFFVSQTGSGATTVLFLNQTPGTGITFVWNFGDGSPDLPTQNIEFNRTLPSGRSLTVALKATRGACNRTATKVVNTPPSGPIITIPGGGGTTVPGAGVPVTPVPVATVPITTGPVTAGPLTPPPAGAAVPVIPKAPAGTSAPAGTGVPPDPTLPVPIFQPPGTTTPQGATSLGADPKPKPNPAQPRSRRRR